jgi:hypothetical protein
MRTRPGNVHHRPQPNRLIATPPVPASPAGPCASSSSSQLHAPLRRWPCSSAAETAMDDVTSNVLKVGLIIAVVVVV